MNRSLLWIDAIANKKRWVIHLLFWIFILVFYVIFFGRRNNNYAQTFLFVGLVMPVTVLASYIMNYYLLPHFFMQQRYGLFLLYSFYLFLAALFLEMGMALATFFIAAELRIDDMSAASFDAVFVLSSLLLVVFFGMAVQLSSFWRKSKEDYQKLMRDKVELELQFLKTQLHPHFIFNTLNNLYFLALEKSDHAPKAILALSELLDYVLHETRDAFVPLQNELQQVRNFISLEMLRYNERLNISLSEYGDVTQSRIAPMMLITLVENAFKHGANKTTNSSWIRITIDVGDFLTITIRNAREGTSTSGHGVGLKNVREQIKLLYGSEGTMRVEPAVEEFLVEVKVPRYDL
jgi:hypothetical protein